MRISRRIWCGSLLVVLCVVGVGVKRYLGKVHQAPAPAEAPGWRADHGTPSQPRASETRPRAPLAVVSRPRFDLEEPIATHVEPVVSVGDSAAESPLPLFGGAPESAVLATQGPRPDEDMRRMPYADEKENTAARR